MPGHEAERARPAVPGVHPAGRFLPSESCVIIPDVSDKLIILQRIWFCPCASSLVTALSQAVCRVQGSHSGHQH